MSTDLRRPFVWGFIATVGALVAISLGGALASLSTVLVWIGVALFIALALDPVVHWLEARKLSRALSILVVFVVFLLAIGGLLAWIIPTAVTQISQFAAAVGYITNIQQSDWFTSLVSATGRTAWPRRCWTRRAAGCPTRRTCSRSAAARSPSARA